MTFVAQLNADRVCTSVADLKSKPPGDRFVEIGSLDLSFIGRHHDGSSWGPAPTDTQSRHITRLAFLQRFTQAERIAIRTAAKSSVAVEDYVAMVEAAQWIDLDRADTRFGVQAMEAASLLSVGRSTEILDAPIVQSERP